MEDYEVIEATSYEFPNDYDDRLNAILSSINLETKSLVLSMVLDQYPKTGGEIRESLANLAEDDTYIPGIQTFSEYCHDTFLPIGMVAEELIEVEQTGAVGGKRAVTKYRFTEEGESFAAPIAALSVVYAVETGISMNDYLGATQSVSKSRSPFNRWKIIESVYDGNRTVMDIAEDKSLRPSLIPNHLNALDSIGMLDYDVADEEQGFSEYELKSVPDEIPKIDESPGVVKQVLEAFESDRVLSLEDIGDRVDSPYSTLKSLVPGMVDEGILKRNGFKAGEIFSSVEPKEPLDRFHDYFQIPVEEVLEGEKKRDELEELSRWLQGERGTAPYRDLTFSRPDEYIIRALNLYKDVARFSKSKPKAERKEQILEIINDDTNELGRGPRRKEIEEQMGVQAGTYLQELKEEGIVDTVREEDDRRFVNYFLTEEGKNEVSRGKSSGEKSLQEIAEDIFE